MTGMDWNTIKPRLTAAWQEFIRHDLRFSHLVVAASIAIGALVNLLFAHGWTIWPVVLAFGILTYINEAVSRNGQGIPPLQVYLFFMAAVVLWLLAVAILASLHPLILILGLLAILYRIAEAILRQRERDRLIASRRSQNLCLHCGHTYDSNAVFCDHCGEEPNPDAAILKRVAQIYRSDKEVERARAALGRIAPATISTKEQALIARRHSGKMTHQSPLPKAAKLGPGRSSTRRV